METTFDNPEYAATPSLWRRLMDYLDWKINPVLLRDLRLYAKGRLMLTAYFLTLGALVLMAILYALIARFDDEDGVKLLSTLTYLLAVVCGALVPNLVFERFRSELANRATELALMSPLTPARLVRGKLVGAWCVSLLVLSTAAPMLATAYLLGGVNILSILGIVAGVMAAGATMPTVQLFMATQRRGRSLSRGIAGMVFVGQLLMMFSYAPLLMEIFVEGRIRHGELLVLLGTLVVAAVLIAQFLYFTTVGRLRGEAEDRDAAPRLSLAFAAYAGGACAFGLFRLLDYFITPGYGPDDHEAAGIIAAFVAVTFCIGFLIVSYSSPTPPRNLAELHRGKPLRRLLLAPGVKSLTAYFLLNAAVILGVSLFISIESDDADMMRASCFALSAFQAVAYGIIAYYYFVVPFVKDKHNPNLLPLTIMLANVGIAILAVFAMVLTGYAAGGDGIYRVTLAMNPSGLLAGCFGGRREVRDVMQFGMVFVGLAMVPLLPIIFGGADKFRDKRAEGGDATS